MALGPWTFGAAAYSASGGTSVSPTHPANTDGDQLVLIIGMKPSTANSGSVTTPTDWTLVTSITGAGGYGATLGADTGNTNLFVYTRTVPIGGLSGSLAVTVATNNVCWATIGRIRPDSAGGCDVVGWTSSDATAGNVSAAFTTSTSITAGDSVAWAMCIPTDVTTPAQFSAHAISATSVTFGTVTEAAESDSATGNDIGGYLAYAAVSSGTTSGNTTVTATAGGTTTNVRGPLVLIRAREGTGGFTIAADAGSFTYSGNNANTLFNRRLVSETMSQTYSGNNANILFNRKIVADVGTYTYSGNNANILFNRDIIAEAGSFSYSGNDATLTYTTALNNYTITADTGSFTYSGNNANVLFNRRIAADLASFSYSGNNAGLLFNRKVIADSGTYTYSGNNATLTYTTVGGYTLTADAGSFSYSGNNANLTVGFKIVADTGTYSYSGNAANLLSNKKVVAEAGAFTYSVNAANLLSGRTVVADTGSYSYSGNAASVLYNRKVIADAGSYSYSGNAASVLYNRKIVSNAGNFTYSGGSANLTVASGFSKIYLGTLNISNLKYGSFNIYEAYLGSTQVWGKARPVNAMIAETVAYTYTGNNATLRVGKTLAANGASYSLSGNNSLLKYGRKLVANAASYTYSGNNAVLSKFYTMTRYATVFDDNGNGSSSITAVFNTNGTISFNTSFGDGASLDTDFTHWHDGGTVSGIGNSRWAKRTLLSGDAVAGSLDTTLVALSASKAIAIQTVAGEGKSGEVLIEIYSDSGGTTKVGQITLTITATL